MVLSGPRPRPRPSEWPNAPAHPPSGPPLLWRGGGGAPVGSSAPLAVGEPVQSQPSPLGRSSLKGAQAGPSAGHGVGGASGEVLAKFLGLGGEAWGNGGGKGRKGIPASQATVAVRPPLLSGHRLVALEGTAASSLQAALGWFRGTRPLRPSR